MPFGPRPNSALSVLIQPNPSFYPELSHDGCRRRQQAAHLRRLRRDLNPGRHLDVLDVGQAVDHLGHDELAQG